MRGSTVHFVGPSMHVFTTRGSEPTYSSNRHDISICCLFVALYFLILRFYAAHYHFSTASPFIGCIV